MYETNYFFQILDNRQHRPVTYDLGETNEVIACSGLLPGYIFQDKDTGRAQLSHLVEERSSGTLMESYICGTESWREGEKPLKEKSQEICRGVLRSLTES